MGEGGEGEGKKNEAGETPTPPPPVVLGMELHCAGCAKKVRKSIRHMPGKSPLSAPRQFWLNFAKFSHGRTHSAFDLCLIRWFWFTGVLSVVADAAANRVVVAGTADAAALKARIESKTKKPVEILSAAGPSPSKPAPAEPKKNSDKGVVGDEKKNSDKDGGGDKVQAGSSQSPPPPKEKEEKKQPPEEGKPKEVGTQEAIPHPTQYSPPLICSAPNHSVLPTDLQLTMSFGPCCPVQAETVLLKIRLHCDACADRIRRRIYKIKGAISDF